MIIKLEHCVCAAIAALLRCRNFKPDSELPSEVQKQSFREAGLEPGAAARDHSILLIQCQVCWLSYPS